MKTSYMGIIHTDGEKNKSHILRQLTLGSERKNIFSGQICIEFHVLLFI